MDPCVLAFGGGEIPVCFVHGYICRFDTGAEVYDDLPGLLEPKEEEEQPPYSLPVLLQARVDLSFLEELEDSVDFMERIGCEAGFVHFPEGVLKPEPVRIVELEEHTDDEAERFVFYRVVDLADGLTVSLRLERVPFERIGQIPHEFPEGVLERLPEEYSDEEQEDFSSGVREPLKETLQDLLYIVDLGDGVSEQKSFFGMRCVRKVGNDPAFFRKKYLLYVVDFLLRLERKVQVAVLFADEAENGVYLLFLLNKRHGSVAFFVLFVGDFLHMLLPSSPPLGAE